MSTDRVASSDEANLLARFTFPESAQRCAEALRSAGYDIVQVDGLDVEESGAGPAVVEWGRHGYQATNLDDKWTSAAAWDNQLGLNWGESIVLTAVVPAEAREHAIRLIKEHGGQL